VHVNSKYYFIMLFQVRMIKLANELYFYRKFIWSIFAKIGENPTVAFSIQYTFLIFPFRLLVLHMTNATQTALDGDRSSSEVCCHLMSTTFRIALMFGLTANSHFYCSLRGTCQSHESFLPAALPDDRAALDSPPH
jgi:hypothetical protein